MPAGRISSPETGSAVDDSGVTPNRGVLFGPGTGVGRAFGVEAGGVGTGEGAFDGVGEGEGEGEGEGDGEGVGVMVAAGVGVAP